MLMCSTYNEFTNDFSFASFTGLLFCFVRTIAICPKNKRGLPEAKNMLHRARSRVQSSVSLEIVMTLQEFSLCVDWQKYFYVAQLGRK